MKPPWRSRKDPGPEAWTGSKKESRGRFRLGQAIIVTAAFLSIVLAGFALWPKIEEFWDEDEVRLEVDEPVAHNPPAEYTTLTGEMVQTRRTEPTVAATVRNHGDDTAWIEEARIKVVAGVRINTCYSQGGGDVPSTRRYRTMLPEFPAGEPRTYRRDLHVEVQPGHGVRPVLAFPKGDYDSTNVYALEVAFVADPGGHVLRAERFVVATPEPPVRSGFNLPESDEALGLAAEGRPRAVIAACFRHNLLGLRRVIAEPGEREADITALKHLRSASTWGVFVDDRPAREIVPELLASEMPEAAIYAVEVAELEDDPGFAATVRERAVSLLLRWGREDLDHYAREAMRNAERAISLEPSPQARRLLWQARAAWRAEEEQAEKELAAVEAG